MENTEEAVPKKTTKDELISNIREWIKIDTDIATLKNEIKNKQTQKKNLTENLVKVMKTNSIDCFDINGGSLVYNQKKTKKCLSGKFLLQQLENYYKDQPEVAKEITQHILNNREETIKEDIRRKIKK
jgi:prolyl oligopeptidase PreP (S9A serine peptidase family)